MLSQSFSRWDFKKRLVETVHETVRVKTQLKETLPTRHASGSSCQVLDEWLQKIKNY